jgi:hypothetical protein
VRRVEPADLAEVLTEQPKQVALRLVGPGVTDFLRRETGCHVRRTLHSGPEIVRVRVLAGHHEPLTWLEQQKASLTAFEQALENQGVLGENPEQLLPVLRSLRFEPEPERSSSLHVEDYALSYVASRRVRHVRELLSDLWLLGAALEPSP